MLAFQLAIKKNCTTKKKLIQTEECILQMNMYNANYIWHTLTANDHHIQSPSHRDIFPLPCLITAAVVQYTKMKHPHVSNHQ